jgi:predicted P-loop ATPase
VILWPDNDAQGWATMMGDVKRDRDGNPIQPISWKKGIIEHLFEINALRVKIVHITHSSRDKGWDIADAEEEGLDRNAVSAIMRDRIQEWPRDKFDAWKRKRISDAAPKTEDEKPPAKKEEAKPEPEPERTRNPAAVRSEIDKVNWRDHLIMNKDGNAIKPNSMQNIRLMLQYEHTFAGTFAWNEFAKEVFIMRRPVWDVSGNMDKWEPRMILDFDITSATCWLEYFGLTPKVNDVGKIIQNIAQHNAYNPVRDNLDRMKWDGVKRLDDMFMYYFGAERSEINSAFGRRWMIGAIARAYKPGCKMDTMIILEGAQGLKKSSALRALTDAICPGLFTDEISDPNSKDAGLQMQGAFLVEIAELDAFRKAEITQIKAWLTRQVDRFRRPYAKIVEEFPRSCVFAGTVNPSGTGYLKDATGARRFWPVKCTGIDLDGIREDGPQLWAEAKHLYEQGENWWLTEEEEALSQTVQEKRYEMDPFAELINDIVRGMFTVKINTIMQRLEIPMERRSQLMAKRIGNHLHHSGWVRYEENGQIIYKLDVDAQDKMI